MDLKVFLFKKVSTITGIVVLIAITLIASTMFLKSLKEVMAVRVDTISSLEE